MPNTGGNEISMPPMPMEPDAMQQSPMDAPEGEEPMGGETGETDGENGPGKDVKKYSGELSQALNNYNEEMPNDEEKVNKYAINMIAAQVADYLSDKDKRSVIKKLQGNGDEDDSLASDEQPTLQEPMPQMESRIVKEIADELINGRKSTKRDEKTITNKEITKNNPFVSER